MSSSSEQRLDRREFLKTTAAGAGAAAVGVSALRGLAAESPQNAAPNIDESKLDRRHMVPTMEYRRLGRTNFMCSRIVQGNAGDENLWRRLLSQGVNYWDTALGYGNSERDLAPFFKRYRDKVWITSKATNVAGYAKIDEGVSDLYIDAMKAFLGSQFDEIKIPRGRGGRDLLPLHKAAVEKQAKTGEKPDLRPAGRRIAELYASKLDESLGRLEVDYVDAYFVHGIEIPWIFDCIELWEAYEKAHKAGKVKHFGFSTHNHQKEVLAAAGVANEKGPWRIDLIMPGVNPVTFDTWRAELDVLKKQDVGVVAMKTTGIKNRPVDGKTRKLEELGEYNEWERSKLYMLHLTEGIIDACIAGIRDMREMERDLPLASAKLSASAARELKAIVRYEMAGACHLCGDCATNCPEHIAVADMIRYHAYLHQYNDRDLARMLYKEAGYNPAHVCSNCGKCADACASNVPITQILYQLSTDLA